MHVIQRVLRDWCLQRVEVNQGASPEDLHRLEQMLAMPLPEDIRLYFILADGMTDGEADAHQLSFWSIDKILREREDMARAHYPLDPRDIAIADVLINSWFLFLRRESTGIVRVFVQGANLELTSLTDFFDRYRKDPGSLCLCP